MPPREKKICKDREYAGFFNECFNHRFPILSDLTWLGFIISINLGKKKKEEKKKVKKIKRLKYWFIIEFVFNSTHRFCGFYFFGEVPL
jgi:phenylalanine-4-hydroxylase